MSDEWQPIETAPKDGTCVLIWNIEGCEKARYSEREEDSPYDMGHDAGWWGTEFAVPGRSFGSPDYLRGPQGQPTHWQPLPHPPVEGA